LPLPLPLLFLPVIPEGNLLLPLPLLVILNAGKDLLLPLPLPLLFLPVIPEGNLLLPLSLLVIPSQAKDLLLPHEGYGLQPVHLTSLERTGFSP